jgi:hypothetical protein
MSAMDQAPVFIIAAARSGTKMLRAALASSSDFVDFPYDINYIWKYRNYDIPHDELTSEHITPEVEFFIKKQFAKLLARSKARRVLEKTVSNSLRVGFVRAIFPEGKIVHLYRDGRDVAADARLCWQSSMISDRIQSKSDLFRKIVDFPIVAAFPYLLSYLRSYLHKAVTSHKHVDSWGPRFDGIDEALRRYSLLEVCGMQWNRSISSSLEGLERLREDKDYINVRYEDLVSRPIFELTRLCEFLEIRDVEPILDYSRSNITCKYVGFWKTALGQEEILQLMPLIERGLKKLGYT